MPQQRPASIDLTSFNCPQCGSLAHQTWYSLYARAMEKDGKPFIIDQKFIDRIAENREIPSELKTEWEEEIKNFETGNPFFTSVGDKYSRIGLRNVWISQCYSCDRLSLWLNDRLVHPASRDGDEPNQDLPDDVRRDYNEARSVLSTSPRAAAALLRLSIQKLCQAIGETGQNLNDDIASLVVKGLDKKIQQALDIVRVIGNNAVHPGQIDLRDDRNTANQLLRLVNLIAEKMISEPKQIQSMFDSLPASARDQIERRDNRAPRN
jgi:hypothetical protein